MENCGQFSETGKCMCAYVHVHIMYTLSVTNKILCEIVKSEFVVGYTDICVEHFKLLYVNIRTCTCI